MVGKQFAGQLILFFPILNPDIKCFHRYQLIIGLIYFSGTEGIVSSPYKYNYIGLLKVNSLKHVALFLNLLTSLDSSFQVVSAMQLERTTKQHSHSVFLTKHHFTCHRCTYMLVLSFSRFQFINHLFDVFCFQRRNFTLAFKVAERLGIPSILVSYFQLQLHFIYHNTI